MKMDVQSIIISTSLESLIGKATSAQNTTSDQSAIRAVCSIIAKEPNAAYTATRLILRKLKSPNEWEALQALQVLELCMNGAGSGFQSEVGKFKFLNELIKLVSPKYNGTETPYAVRMKIIELLMVWSLKYPSETKIRETCEMLRKQKLVMVINDTQASKATADNAKKTSFPFEEDEKSKELKILLRSKDQKDLQAANLLIREMVKEKEEEEKKILDRTQNKIEAETSVQVLSEMLTLYSTDSSQVDKELLKDVYESCVSLRSTLNKIMNSMKKDEESSELLDLIGELDETIKMYERTMTKSDNLQNGTTLVDFSSPVRKPEDVPLITNQTANVVTNNGKTSEDNVVILQDLFNSLLGMDEKTEEDTLVNNKANDTKKPFDDLDVLGKSFLNGLSNDEGKISLNDLAKCQAEEKLISTSENIGPIPSDFTVLASSPSTDDELCLLNEMPSLSTTDVPIVKPVQPLADLSVRIIDIVPENDKKILALSDECGVTTEIQPTTNKPRCDVSVYLVLTTSKNEKEIKDYLFQPIVPKHCRLKLQPPSRTQLPAYNPHIPIESIVQIMLIATSQQDYIPLKFVVSYKLNEETYTEMGQIDSLPV